MTKFKSVLGKILAFFGALSLTLLVLGSIWLYQVLHGTGLDASLGPLIKTAYFLNEFYVDPIDAKATTSRLLAGLVNGLDPHTAYMPPEAMKSFQAEMRGDYGGVGVGAKPTEDDKALKIKDVLEAGPAGKAGIKAGEFILSIDGQSVAQHTLKENFERIRGPVGSTVRLGIARNAAGPAKDVKIERQAIEPPTAQWSWLDAGGKKIFVVRLVQFNDQAMPQTIQAILAARKEYTGNVDGIILDLRDNPGGLVNSAVGIAAIFGRDGDLVVSSKGRSAEHEWRARQEDWNMNGDEDSLSMKELRSANAWLVTAPMAVVVNRRSASASEILAGALKDWKRAIVVGNVTFGKGSIQTILKISPEAGSIKITEARYYTPLGHPIQAVGVPVDVRVESKLDRGPREADLPTHLAGEEKSEVKGVGAEKAPDFDAKDPATAEELKVENERSTFARKLTISPNDQYIAKAAQALFEPRPGAASTPALAPVTALSLSIGHTQPTR